MTAMGEPGGGSSTGSLSRRDVHPDPVVDGRAVPASGLARLRRRLDTLLVSRGEREEAEIERRIRTLPAVTRPNTVAVISPKGGVGKTTSAFLVGNLLAGHLKLRVVAVDANPDFGTLAHLAPDARRAERSLADLLADVESVATAAALGAYVSRLPSGLHLLAAPSQAERMAKLSADDYGRLLAFLSLFYEVILLDLGTGITDPLARFGVEHCDQLVLVTTPEWVTSSLVLGALRHLRAERTTVVLNMAPRDRSHEVRAIEERFRAEHLHRAVTLPLDERLRLMLDTGTYALEALGRETRQPVKLLGLSVAEQLV